MKQISIYIHNVILIIFICLFANLTLAEPNQLNEVPGAGAGSVSLLPVDEFENNHPVVSLTRDEQAWLSEHPLIRVSILNAPPYQYWDNGPKGISVELTDLIAARVGFKVRYIYNNNWPETLDNIRHHKQVDLLLTVNKTQKREIFMAFSKAYLKLPWVIFTRQDEQAIFGIKDLFARTISIEKSYAMQKILATDFPQIKQHLVGNAAEALAALSTGQVDAYVGNLTVAQYQIVAKGLNNLKIAAPTGLDDLEMSYGLRNDWPLFASILDKGLDAVAPEELAAINRKYFTINVEQGGNLVWVLWIVSGLTVLLLFILFWNRLLRFKVNERTAKFQQSEAKYRRLIDSLGADYIFFTLDPQGLLIYLSDSSYAMMGYRPEEGVGQHYTVFHTDASVSKEAIANTEAGLRGEILAPFEAELRHRDGTLVQVEATEAPVFDHQGKVIALEGLLHNITRRKQTEIELQKHREELETLVDERTIELRKLSRAVEQSHSTIVITDLEGNIEFVNPAFKHSSGYTREEALGQNPRILKSGQQDDAFYKEMWDTLRNGDVWQGEMHNKRKDGLCYWEFATISPVKDDKGISTHYVAVKEDITKRKETEEQLAVAQQRAEDANQAKSEFLANMSHDIRTPMNGIVGMTSLALDTDLSPEQLKYLKNIKLSADSLLSLLNDILDFSKIEAGQLVMEKHNFSLPETLGNIISIMGHAAEDKGLELILENDAPGLPLFIKGDELRLRQILLNLIGNSIKFTEVGSVAVRVVPEKREDNKLGLHFMVIDTGIGIPVDKQETIFSSFSQADASTTRKFGGTGLGLAICRQLVELMEGEIWVENNGNHGTIFHFTVVFDQGNSQNIQQSDMAVLRIKKLNILLVDDNAINCEIARNTLEKDEHYIVTAPNGLVSLGLLASQDFDLILMDVQMPVMDGLTASGIIRESEQGNDLSHFDLPQPLPEQLIKRRKGRHIPIVAMTANAMEGDKEKCLSAGMDNYLTKPFEPARVRVVIAETVNSSPE